jgi:hypothetical protein
MLYVDKSSYFPGKIMENTLKEQKTAQPGPDAASIRRILVTAYGHIADVLPSGPALHALRETYPQARITVLAVGYVKEMLAACPYVDEVLISSIKARVGPKWSRC